MTCKIESSKECIRGKKIWKLYLMIYSKHHNSCIKAIIFLRLWKWYFVTKIILTVLLWEKIVIVIEINFWNSRLKTVNLQNFEITRTIYSNSAVRGPNNFWYFTECIFNLFLEVSHTLIHLWNCEKILVFRNMQEMFEIAVHGVNTVIGDYRS